MDYQRPIVLSVAGFDPSGGAGVLADVKTFEQHKCLGFAVISAIVCQNEQEVTHVQWLQEEDIRQQIQPLLDTYSISVVKFGAFGSLELLYSTLCFLRDSFPEITIVWDPILQSTSGQQFLETENSTLLQECYKKIDLITPNALESSLLTGIQDAEKAAASIANFTAVLLKGGHRKKQLGVDVLYFEGRKVHLESSLDTFYDKHGTGCILSASIVAQIAHGRGLLTACKNAKQYIETTTSSNTQKLAYHVQ